MDFTPYTPFWLSLGGRSSIHCAGGWLLLGTTVFLCLGISHAYILIALDWWRREKSCTSRRGRLALRDLRIIFIWCAISGYLFRVLLSVVPLWSPYLVSLVWLNIISWRYYNRLTSLSIVYSDAEKLESIHRELRAVNLDRYNKIPDLQQRLQAIEKDLEGYLEK